MVDAAPGEGPRLHQHPYEEIFIFQEGMATFTVGDQTREGHAGQVIIVPPRTPHTFINTGAGRLRQVDIHASERFTTEWLEAE
ncbi:MAG TPA: cupin domain-containing protein [Ktedonobacterales bacterium]